MKLSELTKEFLESELQEKVMSQISKETNIPWPTLYKRMKLWNITQPKMSERKEKEWIGRKINHLVVKKCVGRNNYGNPIFLCECDCGNTCERLKRSLQEKHISSCGCHRTQEYLKDSYEQVSNNFFKAVKRGADDRGMEFLITKEDIWKKYVEQNGLCALSGVEISLEKHGGKTREQTASVDRKDSSKGYTVDNIQIVHKDINVAKRAKSDKDFIEMCCNVADFQRNKNAS